MVDNVEVIDISDDSVLEHPQDGQWVSDPEPESSPNKPQVVMDGSITTASPEHPPGSTATSTVGSTKVLILGGSMVHSTHEKDMFFKDLSRPSIGFKA